MPLFRREAPPARRPRFRITQPKALVASVASVGVEDARALSHAPVSGTLSRIERALGFYSTEGACWNPAQFYARSMKRIRYYPAILSDEGEPEEVTDGPLRDLFEQIHDPGGTGMAELAANYGRLSFLIGDGYLIVSEQEGEEVWEYLSPLELRRINGTTPQEYERNTGVEKTTLVDAGPDEPIGGDRVRVWRLWRRHPTRSGWSDSPVFAVLNLYALLERLNLSAGATSWSRAANRGMMYIPDEVDLGGQDDDPNDPGVDEDPIEDSSLRELIEAFTSPIKDPGDVGGAAPVIIRGPAMFEPPSGHSYPYAQLIANIPIGNTNPYYELDAVPKVIEQIALGLDMPNEMVTGTGSVNHWGGWLLDEQGFRQHVAGVVEDFCDDVASAFLRPAAAAEGIQDADRVVIWYDPVAAIAHPDQGAQALDAVKVGAVGRAYLRDAIGATEEDAATPEDEAFLLELLGRKTVDPNAPQGGETAPQAGGTGADTTEAPPAEPANGNGNGATAAADVRAALIIGAAEMQVKQARKAAGARLKSWSQGCFDCQEAIVDLPLTMVASVLGQQRVRELLKGKREEHKLVSGAGEMLAAQIRDWGVEGTAPDELGAMMEAHASRTIYTSAPPPLPPGFAAVVAKALK